MFLSLNHKKLEVFQTANLLAEECYKLTTKFPPEEKFSICSQIRRASISVILNIAEGSSRKSAIERRRFFEISRGSVIELDAAFSFSVKLRFLNQSECEVLGKLLNSTFAQLTNLIKA
jgi:four helix bundle protein